VTPDARLAGKLSISLPSEDAFIAMASLSYFFGGTAANFEPRMHIRPRGSCQRRSVA
jgi:hypothetical protein